MWMIVSHLSGLVRFHISFNMDILCETWKIKQRLTKYSPNQSQPVHFDGSDVFAR
jgi:hypothetical protein